MLTVGSLFSGIGGIELGLERTGGFKTVWQVEIDSYAQKVLAKHWPDVTRYGDIREVGIHNLAPVELMCGGFPCQDISNAGKRAGIEGSRSGLWSEFYRLICELRPQYVLVENVAALLGRGIDTVLGNLSASGYDAEWQVLSASAFGAPHIRARVFIVAYSSSSQCDGRFSKQESKRHAIPLLTGTNGDREQMAYASSEGLQRSRQERELSSSSPISPAIFKRGSSSRIERSSWWTTESSIRRVAHGIPSRVDRIKGLGNAVVPQIAQFLGECILEHRQRIEEMNTSWSL